jgi:hypothetical protein
MGSSDAAVSPLDVNEIYRHLDLLRSDDIEIHYYPLHYRRGDYRFPKIISREIGLSDRIVMIGAGVHANEIAGPLTFARHGRDIIRYAQSRGLRIICYPLRNPSGYGIPGKRYNIDSEDDAVVVGNNDFVRYRLPDGRIVDDLRGTNIFTSWEWTSDPQFHVPLPSETRLMHDLLRQDPLGSVQAVVDLHQDWITKGAPPLAYHYAFGDVAVYQPIVREIEKLVPIARHRRIGAGYRGLAADGRPTRESPEQALSSDDNGFICRHDGTWTDLLFRIGESQGRRIHCVTPETTGATPLEIACQVNLIWIYGIMDLVAGEA